MKGDLELIRKDMYKESKAVPLINKQLRGVTQARLETALKMASLETFGKLEGLSSVVKSPTTNQEHAQA